MKHLNIKIVLTGVTLFLVSALMQSCSTDVGGNEDRAAGTITLTSLHDGNGGADVVGSFTITWDNNEPNRSTVDIELSSDAGENFDTVIAINAADNGAYEWDSNTVTDCRRCRIRITGTDVVGNVTAPADSTADFVVNNVPQVLGAALYRDPDANGIDGGDTITIPFDKNIELNALVAGDTFFMPVLGDNLGAFSTMKLGAASNEVVITINEIVSIPENLHLHIRGSFDSTKTGRTAPSGLDILSGLAGEVIFSPVTGRTAEPLGDGIDLVPTFGEIAASGITALRTSAVALADLDDNGVLDAVVIHNTSTGGNDHSVYSGDGDGTFTPIGVQELGDFFPGLNNAVAVGDIDGVDGPDIVVGVGLGQPNIVYYNNANDGNFLTKAALTLGNSNTFAVALGDIDGNGSLDLVTGNDGANRVWRNNGSGVLAEDGIPQTLGNNATTGIELADVDGDGDLDIITGNGSDQPNRVYTNNGAGVFADSGQALGSSGTLAIAVADVDGDGDVDIATGNDITQADRVWLNDGKGGFTDSGQLLSTNRTKTLELVDIDADGDPDLIKGSDNNFNNTNKVWFNDGEGVFTDSGQSVSNNVTWSLAFGDLDGDQDIDMLEGVFSLNEDVVWLNSQRIRTQAIFIDSDQSLGSNDTSAVVSGDVDGDGDLDVIAGNFDQGNQVWLNNINNNDGGTGALTDSGQSLGSKSTSSIVLGDLDGDGDLDMIEGNGTLSGQDNLVWRNDGKGVFTDSGQSLGSGGTAALAIGDIDGDNDLDFIAGNADGPNRVWRNNGAGVFSEDVIPQTLGLGITLSLAMADIDGDTDLDFVEADTIGADRVWLNNGINTGNFVQGQSFGSINTQALVLGDLDGDGDPDLVVGKFFQNIEVWENNGAASNMFVNPQTIPATNLNTRSLVLRDVDGDGDRDLIVGNYGDLNRVYINNGKGVFTAYPVRDNGSLADGDDNDTISMAVGDFDGDGDPDIFTGNAGGQANRLWLNDF